MINLDWHNPNISDIEILQKSSINNQLFGNNYSAVNSYLYSRKFNSQIALINNWILEKYTIDNKEVFTFPHNIDGNSSTKNEIISILKDEARNSNKACIFRNITSQEKDILLNYDSKAKIEPSKELNDYIYLSENLANLPGSKYAKKRNHINQFVKKYPDYVFEFLNEANLHKAFEVEEKWLGDNQDKDLLTERSIIQNAFDNFTNLNRLCNLKGGLILVHNEPIAFCLASTLNTQITDIHFEKCIAPFSQDGGYAIINKDFSKTISTKYINREEDLGIEGLRKAKLSYYPEIILDKFIVTL